MKTPKQTEREQLNQAVNDYLKRGGKIRKIEQSEVTNTPVLCFSKNVRDVFNGGWSGPSPRCYQPRGIFE
jgi:hypothetical protein